MIILGVDPGSGCTGYGLLQPPSTAVAFGAIRPPASAELGRRLLHISDKLGEIIEQHKPDHCVVENIFYSTNARSALVLGHVRGAIILTALRHGCPVHEYTALQIKKAVTGQGKAEKEQVKAMVSILLNVPAGELTFDAADALAAALCHAQTWATNSALREQVSHR